MLNQKDKQRVWFNAVAPDHSGGGRRLTTVALAGRRTAGSADPPAPAGFIGPAAFPSPNVC